MIRVPFYSLLRRCYCLLVQRLRYLSGLLPLWYCDSNDTRPLLLTSAQVLLPVAPETEVPEWFFERTPADVKVEYMSIRKQREEGQQIRIRAKKEGQQEGKEAGRVATVRVRFPEVRVGAGGISMGHCSIPVFSCYGIS